MRMHVLAAVLVACGTAVASAQGGAGKSQPTPKQAKPITLIGCIADDESNPGQLTFEDASGRTVYRLGGTDTRHYVGRRVQIVGTSDAAKIKVRGGLTPSPNTAAQAGAIDPSRAAVSAQTESRGTGTETALPTFTVKAVKPAKGDCPSQK